MTSKSLKGNSHNQTKNMKQNLKSLQAALCLVTSLGFTLLLSACHNIFNVSPFSSSEKFSSQHTNDIYATLAATHHPRILQAHGGAYHNPKLERLLIDIVKKLAAVSHNPGQTYKVTILDSSNINAFSLPGGYLYVTRGMLTLANDSSEVAAVLAHEIAHITAHHGILRFQKEAQLKKTPLTHTDIVSSANSQTDDTLQKREKMAQFSRDQELQADSIGIEMLSEAGYDPFAASRFLQSMEAYNAFRNISGNAQSSLDFLETHPTTPQRIRLAQEKAHLLNTRNSNEISRDTFLHSIDGIIFDGGLHEGYIRERKFIYPRLRISFEIPDRFIVNTSPHAVISSGPDKIAFRFDAVPISGTISASDYLKSGWVANLDETSVNLIKIGNLEAARGRAFNEHWQFSIIVIPYDNHFLRFVTAAPHQSENFHHIVENILRGFRPLSWLELKRIKPLKIRTVRVKKGDSIVNFSQMIQDVPDKEKLFRILNGLTSTETLQVGSFVKIITE
ncbi:M48 family metalloprotease [Bartonella ancashensis]|nr:M48 family metalloprotease [Bartonella ancashensis]